MAVTSAQLQELYVALLGRAADKGGLDYWLGQLNAEGATLTLENVRANFVNEQAEYKATYGNLSREDLVKTIYQNLFERVPSAGEVAYWVADGVNADQLVVAFLNGASAADQQVVSNKVTVAQYYTAATGANYNAAAAKAIIADVDGTATSVANAIGALDKGTLPGAVPGQALIAKQAAAVKAVADLQKDMAKANPTFDGIADADSSGGNVKNGSVDLAELNDAKLLASADRGVVTVLSTTTTVTSATTATLEANVTNASGALALAKASVAGTVDGAAAVQAYESALNAYLGLIPTAQQVAANNVAISAAQAGFDAAIAVSGSAVTIATLNATTLAAADIDGTNTAADVYGQLVNIALSSSERAALVAETQKVGTYGAQLIEYANKQFAINKASDAYAKAKAAVELKTGGSTFTTAVETKLVADAVLADAKADDAKISAIDTLIAQLTAANKAAADANTAISNFKDANLSDLFGNGTTAVPTVDTKGPASADLPNDVFYFSGAIAGGDDFAITGFGVNGNDALILGNGFSYNAGALTTGNNNVQEFFLVSSAAGVQVVVESSKYGSDGVVVGAGGVVTTTTADNIAVITLSGVSIDNVQVNDGVISYVA